MKHPMWDLQPKETCLPEGVTKMWLQRVLDETNWTPRKLFVKLLKEVGWEKTGKEIFEAIMFPIFPAVPSECAVVRYSNEEPHVLMWHRDDEYYTGHHMPGKYILRGESDEEWVRRTIAAETGLELVRFEFIRRFNTRPETGWVPGQQMAHFWYCEVSGEPTNGIFYPLTAIPEDTFGHHKKYVDCLRAFLMRRKTMREVGIRHDGKHSAPPWKWLVACSIYFNESKEWYRERHEYDTLNGALTGINQLQPQGGFHLYDDTGQQIV